MLKNMSAGMASQLTVEFRLTVASVDTPENYYYALGVAHTDAINKMIGPPESYAVIGTFPRNDIVDTDTLHVQEYSLKSAAPDGSGIAVLNKNVGGKSTPKAVSDRA